MHLTQAIDSWSDSGPSRCWSAGSESSATTSQAWEARVYRLECNPETVGLLANYNAIAPTRLARGAASNHELPDRDRVNPNLRIDWRTMPDSGDPRGLTRVWSLVAWLAKLAWTRPLECTALGRASRRRRAAYRCDRLEARHRGGWPACAYGLPSRTCGTGQ